MASYLTSTGLSLAAGDRLRMLGVQTDSFGTVLGGHQILLDPALPGSPDNYAVSDDVPNRVQGGGAMTCRGAFASGIVAGGGLGFTTASGLERIELPAAADLLSLQAGRAVVISVWLTTASAGQTSAWSAIAGYGRQSATWSQWGISYTGATGAYDLRVCGQALSAMPAAGTPELLTLYVDAASGIARTEVYQGAQSLGVLRHHLPLADPAQSGEAGLYPSIGWMSGFAQEWIGTLHRFQLIEVDPSVFDIGAWLTDEIAANGGRWAA